MATLILKKEVELELGQTCSICLRRARNYDTSEESALSIYTPSDSENPKYLTKIVSQSHFKFQDLENSECEDNYNTDAQTVSGLLDAMNEAYDNFSTREIVTILKFQRIIELKK